MRIGSASHNLIDLGMAYLCRACDILAVRVVCISFAV
jgi:hypothetical protein